MKYAAIDSEGSGLFDWKKPADAPGQPRMAALGMVLLDGNLNIESKHSWLIKPNGWTFDDNSEAAAVNGLTHARLMAEGVDAMEPLVLVGNAINERRIWVGFNPTHDMKSFRAESRILGLPDLYMQTRYICVMQGSRQLVDARTADGRKKVPKLEEACAYFGIEIEEKGAHTGIGGAERAAQILIKLRDLGCMPAFKDPYEKGPKKPASSRPANWQRSAGADYEQEVVNSQDFIGGASEDGK
jgi:DNA polymerase III epsilon subunit-like protein